MAAFQPNPDPGFFGTLSGLFGGLDRFEEQQRLAAARAAALRGQSLQPPQQPQIEQAQSAILSGVGGGATGSWDAPPQQPAQQPMPAQAPPAGPRLPKAMAGYRPPPQQPMPQQGPQAAPQQPIAPAAGPSLDQQREIAFQQQQAALAPVDTSALEAMGRRRQQAASQNLLLALAAQEAGSDFKPLSAHFARQAAESSGSMKTAGGWIDETGQYVADPEHDRTRRLQIAQNALADIDRRIANAKTQAEKQAYEQQKLEVEERMHKETLALRRDIAAGRHQPSEPLVQVVGPDGVTPTLVPRSQAAGMQPYHRPAGAGANNPAAARQALDELPGMLDQAERTLPGATGSGAGRLVDQAANFIGVTTGGAQGAAQLKSIAAGIVSRLPRMAGAVSDADLQFLKEQAGQLGDESLPIGVRQAALAALRETLNRNRQAPGGPAAPAQPQATAAPSVDDLVNKYRTKGK